eukprot:3008835-Amphidinium_carterae.1
MVFPEAPVQLGQHLRVVRHAAFLQCLDCGRQTGNVKGCRKLKKKKVKVRPTGFLATETRSTGSGGDPPAGGATGGCFLLRAIRSQDKPIPLATKSPVELVLLAGSRQGLPTNQGQ